MKKAIIYTVAVALCFKLDVYTLQSILSVATMEKIAFTCFVVHFSAIFGLLCWIACDCEKNRG